MKESEWKKGIKGAKSFYPKKSDLSSFQDPMEPTAPDWPILQKPGGPQAPEGR